ncbi:hypothetical protein BH20ACT24_BH20ACT24_03800 [soil metagenome]
MVLLILVILLLSLPLGMGMAMTDCPSPLAPCATVSEFCLALLAASVLLFLAFVGTPAMRYRVIHSLLLSPSLDRPPRAI